MYFEWHDEKLPFWYIITVALGIISIPAVLLYFKKIGIIGLSVALLVCVFVICCNVYQRKHPNWIRIDDGGLTGSREGTEFYARTEDIVLLQPGMSSKVGRNSMIVYLRVKGEYVTIPYIYRDKAKEYKKALKEFCAKNNISIAPYTLDW